MERAEKTRVLQEQAEQKKREREKKKADLQKESARKRARQESRSDGESHACKSGFSGPYRPWA